MLGTFNFIDRTLGELGYSSSEGKKLSKLERLRKWNEEMTPTVLNVSLRIVQLQYKSKPQYRIEKTKAGME
jgi:hypothetical protein